MTGFHGNLTQEKFWIEWFGPLGRDLGTNRPPHRNWTDNPEDFLEFIKMCAKEHEDGEFARPCWISAQPMEHINTKSYILSDSSHTDRRIGEACAIEKLFFDFDDDTKYCPKCDKYIKKDDFRPIKGVKGSFCPKCNTECEEKPRLDVVGKEVKLFLKNIKHEVFVVETRKGYHVYIFLSKIFQFRRSKFEFAKQVYELLQRQYITRKYEFIDERIIGDLNRFARVPLTAHEKTGTICQIVDRELKSTKVRNLDFYRTYGIRESEVENAINTIEKRIHDKAQKTEREVEEMKQECGLIIENGNGYQGVIRPCFQIRMDIGEMCHAQRLAWLSEIYHSGYSTKIKMIELCRKTWNDFDEKISTQQIEDYFKHERWKWKPYRCATIMQKGWCIEKDCPIWNAKIEKANKH